MLRTIRDVLSAEFKSVWVDSVDQYQRIVEFLDQIQPQLVSRVRLYRRDEPIFDEFNIEAEIAKALKSKVWLKSGGYIVINQTEALVAIDVNTGRYVGKRTGRLEDTIVKTNLEAVKEIVRQIRLRDLGGIIVLDPSTMPGGYTFDGMKDELASRVTPIPSFRRKLRTVPLHLDHPIWVDDEDFDIDRHVHRLALPSPGGDKELADVCAHLAGIPLDRSRRWHR